MTRHRVLLGIVLAGAFLARVWGLGFGLPHVMARPDEAQIAGPAVLFLGGDLRPPHLEWPTLFAYTVSALYLLYFVVTRPFSGHATLAAFAESRRVDISPFLYVTRGVSALMGTLTVWWIYGLGRRAFDATVGLVAALFLAVSFLHVRDSHFGVTDVAMSALAVLAVSASLRWRQAGGAGRAALAGMAAGLTASAKYNGALVVAAFAVAVAQRFAEDRRGRRAAAADAALALALFSAACAAAFFGTSPYVLIDWPRFLAGMRATQSMVLHGHGLVLGQGWSYYAGTILPAAVGWPIVVAGAAGAVLMLATRFRDAAVVLAFPVVYYAVAGRGLGVFARYMLPVLPFLCLAAAWITVEAVRVATRRAGPAVRHGALAACAILMAAPAAYETVLLDRLLATPDNREVTGRALSGLVPGGALLYQTGEPYGHAPLGVDRRGEAVRVARFDEASGAFSPAAPDWILVQRSPLVLYSRVPPAVEEILRAGYVLVRRFPTESEGAVRRTYDQQDAFYLPLSGLEGLERPGPAFELYARRP